MGWLDSYSEIKDGLTVVASEAFYMPTPDPNEDTMWRGKVSLSGNSRNYIYTVCYYTVCKLSSSAPRFETFLLGHAAPQLFMRILGGNLHKTMSILANPLTKLERNN